jgi:hypothetical protein
MGKKKLFALASKVWKVQAKTLQLKKIKLGVNLITHDITLKMQSLTSCRQDIGVIV